MAKSFEELEVWQAARRLVNSVYNITNNGSFKKDFGLKEQIRRAAVSVLSNIAEGFERGGNREFCNFLYIAKRSAGEVRSQLYVAFDQNYISRNDFDSEISRCIDISNQLSGFTAYLRGTDIKGEKYRKL